MSENKTELTWKIREKDGTVYYEGIMCDMREVLEELVGKVIGVFPELQEDEEEGIVYLHSEFGDELEPHEIALLHTNGISEDYDDSTLRAIENLLEITVTQY